jgi:hypothetical protein
MEETHSMPMRRLLDGNFVRDQHDALRGSAKTFVGHVVVHGLIRQEGFSFINKLRIYSAGLFPRLHVPYELRNPQDALTRGAKRYRTTFLVTADAGINLEELVAVRVERSRQSSHRPSGESVSQFLKADTIARWKQCQASSRVWP